MNREERKEQTQWNAMLKRYSHAIIEVWEAPNPNYKPPEKPIKAKNILNINNHENKIDCSK